MWDGWAAGTGRKEISVIFNAAAFFGRSPMLRLGGGRRIWGLCLCRRNRYRKLLHRLGLHPFETSSPSMSSSSSSKSDINSRLSPASDHDSGSTMVEKLVL